jgi:hypothetical protein
MLMCTPCIFEGYEIMESKSIELNGTTVRSYHGGFFPRKINPNIRENQ